MTLPQDCKPSRHSFVRSKHGPFLRPGQGSHRRRAPRRSRAAVRPARQRFTLDGREHDGSLAIPRDDGVHRDDSGIIDAVEQCSACRASIAADTSSEQSNPSDPFAAFVTEASRRFAVPEHWIRAVMRVESGEKSRARSRKGAMGLMQIMPRTWAELRARHGLGADPYDPHDNILAGTAYIRELYDRYGAPGFLAAYNAGPGRYERHLATGRPLPAETQAYVATLAPMIKRRADQRAGCCRRKHRSPGLTRHCSRAHREHRRPTSDHQLTCVRTVHHAPTPLSIYRPSYRSRATCSYVVPEESDRNDRDRASSYCVAAYRMF